jgi:hypothetical protein
MKHRDCHSLRTKVVDKRDSNGHIRRRRECLKCGQRFTTREIPVEEFKELMEAKTYLAVGELVQAAAHQHGLVGPVQFTACPPRDHLALTIGVENGNYQGSIAEDLDLERLD